MRNAQTFPARRRFDKSQILDAERVAPIQTDFVFRFSVRFSLTQRVVNRGVARRKSIIQAALRNFLDATFKLRFDVSRQLLPFIVGKIIGKKFRIVSRVYINAFSVIN